ncbi:MAG TPA: cyclase family protein [Blastocatellia bacterium]|nr:cyclase family protein [Blastocatellia bacterium]
MRFIIALVLISTVVVAAPQRNGEGLLERAFSGKARVIELSHDLSSQTPTFGGERDTFRYERLSEVDREGYASGAVRLPEHFGTHVDSPGHFIKGAATIDRIDVRRFIAPAAVIDVRKQVRENPDYRLTVADLRDWERTGRIPAGAAVLLLTGWDARYNDWQQYRNPDKDGVLHFPGYSEEAIKYLIDRQVVALGIDTLSIDYGRSKDFAGHKLSHQAGLYHIENLTHLDQLPARGAAIFVGPLAIRGGSGSPARVLAIAP